VVGQEELNNIERTEAHWCRLWRRLWALTPLHIIIKATCFPGTSCRIDTLRYPGINAQDLITDSWLFMEEPEARIGMTS